MERHAPVRYFALCRHCGEAYVATLSRFTPWVCKKCGWHHGVTGTSLDYGDEVFDPVAEPAPPRYPLPPRPPARPSGSGGGAEHDVILGGDAHTNAWMALGIAVLFLFLLWQGLTGAFL